MPDPQDEPPQSGQIGPGRVHHPGAAAFESGPTRAELDERDRRTSIIRKPMGPPPEDDEDDDGGVGGVGAFDDEFPGPPDVPPTTPA